MVTNKHAFNTSYEPSLNITNLLIVIYMVINYDWNT